MPSGRTKYDAVIPGRRVGTSANGNTLSSKSQTVVNASTRRAKNIDDNLFVEENDKDRYLITYADLITLLLGLFIILYASSNIDLQKYQKLISSMSATFGGSSGDKVGEIQTFNSTPPDLKTNVQNIASAYGYGGLIRVEENERGVVIHILEDILFTSGKAEIKESSENVLKKLSAMLRTIPNDIRIEGHTDNVPIHNMQYPSNWHLSVNRALNTAYYLINRHNLPADRVSVVGYSEYRPVADNTLEEGRNLNRRVDIVIIKK